jgi:Protein of unknown function (DUF2867).
MAKAMKSVIRSQLPVKSIIANDFGVIDYWDSFRITKPIKESLDKIAADIFTTEPRWVKSLMSVRNSLVRIFGLKTDKLNQKEIKNFYPVGSRLAHFTVLDRNEYEIVLGEDDKHLNFRTSVFIDKANSSIYLSTIVQFNNIGGKIYFFPVKPFHRFIIKSCLKSQL